jgi:hypothetical protein
MEAASEDEAAFQIVNKTHTLVPYDQAILLRYHDTALKAAAVSGNAVIDPTGPHANLLQTLLPQIAPPSSGKKAPQIHDIKPQQISPQDKDKWSVIARPHNLVLVLETAKEGRMGCVLLQRQKPFSDAERTLLGELAEGYSSALALHVLRSKSSRFSSLSLNSKTKKIIAAALVLAFFIPVKLTITAPAEIVAEDSKAITAPFQGMIEDISVSPGDAVQQGDTLLTMDREALRAEAASAAQALELARISLSRTRREALADPQKKAEISALEAEIKSRQIEFDYAQDLLNRSILTSPQDGVAVFSDANSLKGKPVGAGEKIMMIANPQTLELLVRVPADAMIPLEEDADVYFYANAAPLRGYAGEALNAGYQASADPDGLMTYKLRASLQRDDDLRIGWKGTAKIYGNWTILGYSLLRRPLIALRNMTGL